MEALNHREEAFNSVRIFADQFSGNPDIRTMLGDLLATAADAAEGRTQFRKLAEELDTRPDAGAPTGGGDLTQIPDVDAGPPLTMGGDLIFIDVGKTGPGGAARGEPVDGFDLGRPEADDADDWRRDTSAVEGLEIISSGLEDDADAPVVPELPEEAFGEADEARLDIDAYPPVDQDDDELRITSVELDEEAASGGDPSLATPFETLEDATHADPRLEAVEDDDADQDLVFLSVDEGVEPSTEDAPTTATPTRGTDDDPAIAARNRGQVLAEVGDRAGAIEALEDAVQRFEATGRYEEALDAADELSRLEPAAVFRYQKRVELAYRCGRRDVMLQSYLGLADALLRNGGTDHAIVVYRRVLEHDPGNPVARAALANLTPAPPAGVEEAPPPAASFVDLGSLILDEPSSRDTRIRVGQAAPIEDEDQAFHEALAQFKRGIEENLDAEDFQAHYDLGVAFKEMGLLDEAIAEFQKALRSPEGRLKTSEALGICLLREGPVRHRGGDAAPSDRQPARRRRGEDRPASTGWAGLGRGPGPARRGDPLLPSGSWRSTFDFWTWRSGCSGSRRSRVISRTAPSRSPSCRRRCRRLQRPRFAGASSSPPTSA